MTEEIDKDYEQESTIANSQNQQYEFNKDEENITQQEVITNLHNNNQQYKFDVDVEETNAIGILPSPNSSNPIKNLQLATKLRDSRINQMLDLKEITSEEADEAKKSNNLGFIWR